MEKTKFWGIRRLKSNHIFFLIYSYILDINNNINNCIYGILGNGKIMKLLRMHFYRVEQI